jgi:hypothetical protein
MPPRTSPKKDAVLAIGLDKPTADIVASAKGRGVEVSTTYVDLLKKGVSSGRPKKAASSKKPSASKAPQAKKSKTAKTPKAAASTPGAKPVTKADYVRSFGPSVMPAEIMERAKKDGVPLTLQYLYNLRKTAKKAGKGIKAVAKPSAAPAARAPSSGKTVARAPKRVATPRREATTAVPAGGDAQSLRTAVAAYVVEHGIAAARVIVEDVGAKLRAAAQA